MSRPKMSVGFESLEEMVSFHLKGKRPSDLSGCKQLGIAELLARAAGLDFAARMIATEQERRYPIRGWEYGACVWCETEGKRRKATMLDIGSGTPECDRHGLEARS